MLYLDPGEEFDVQCNMRIWSSKQRLGQEIQFESLQNIYSLVTCRKLRRGFQKGEQTIFQRSQVRKNQLSSGFSTEEVIDDFRISSFCGFVGAETKSYLMKDWVNNKEMAKLNEDDSRSLDKREQNI